MKMMKCLVCGEIFDPALTVCPVCGVGKEKFVEIEVEEQSFTRDTEDVYVILGNGTAGLSAAKAIRERDRTGIIFLVSKEPHPSYHRPMLTKQLSKQVKAEELEVCEDGWYEEHQIIQMLEKTVSSIDMEERKVSFIDETWLKYDKLIYAMGAESFIPPIQGREKPQVIAIRTIEDTEKIRKLLPEIKSAVVIGGGVLGLEAAWELKKSGCQVTVLELAPQLMGRQLDPEAGEWLKAIAQDAGIAIHTGVQIHSIEGEEKVTGVMLEDGTCFTAELVIISCGVRANTAIAAAAGIKTDRAVVVDEHMRTNFSNVFACGDCAQYEGVNYAVWPEASDQGAVAGANAAGEAVSYRQEAPGLFFQGMNTALFAIGDTGKNPQLIYETEEEKDMEKRQYRKLYYAEGQLKGGILIGDVSDMGELMEHMQGRKKA